MALDVLSRKLNLSADVLVQLNPELKGKRTPRSYPGPYEIRVPSGKTTEWMETYVAEAVQENPRIKEIEVLKDKVENPQNYPMPKIAERAQVHVVKRGENLSLIARKHRMSVGKLAQLNRMSWRSHVRVGQRLKLNREPMATVARVAVIRSPAATEVHRVKRGETLSLIARRYDMTLQEMALLNRLTVRSQVRVGQLLRLKGASRVEVKKFEAPIVYKLGTGETLTDVARWFGTDVASLKRHNKISQGRALQAGKSIQIPETKKGIYKVQPGDYLIKIAQKFNLNQVALIKLNKLKSGKVYPGQRLVVNLE
jgi:LysM repeat protein